jgi:hypothetical protein
MGGAIAATVAVWPVATVRLRQVGLRGFSCEHYRTTRGDDRDGQSVENGPTHKCLLQKVTNFEKRSCTLGFCLQVTLHYAHRQRLLLCQGDVGFLSVVMPFFNRGVFYEGWV